MKVSRCDTHRNSFAVRRLRFESQQLASFGGLVLLQKLFSLLNLTLERRVAGATACDARFRWRGAVDQTPG